MDSKEIKPILKEINPEYSLEGLMLKLQYFGHLMPRTDSLEKTLMLGKIEGQRRKGQQLIWQHCHQARHAGVEGGRSRCHSHLVLEAPEMG